MQTLIKSISGERGKLYAITEGRRILLAEHDPKLEIYENSKRIEMIGSRSYDYKTNHVCITICGDMDMTREVDADFLHRVTRFEFIGDFQHENGMYERITLDNIAPIEMGAGIDWKFEVVGQYADTVKLANFK